MDAGPQQQFQIPNNEVNAKLRIEQNSKPHAQLMLKSRIIAVLDFEFGICLGLGFETSRTRSLALSEHEGLQMCAAR